MAVIRLITWWGVGGMATLSFTAAMELEGPPQPSRKLAV